MVPGGMSVIGDWTCLKTMASEDSEGCVRLYPGHKVDAADLADYLHCEPALVETALDVFGKLQWITVEDGVIRVPGFGKAGLSEAELA